MTKTAMISVYLNTWGNYNENGADGGFWVDLPCNLSGTLEQLAESTGERLEDMEVFVNDYDTDLNGVEISEDSNLSELNELAEQLAELDESDIEKLGAILEADGGTLENALKNLDSYTYYSGMTLLDVAYELVEECYSNLPEIALRYFDYEAFARDLGFNGYTETSNGVVCR